MERDHRQQPGRRLRSGFRRGVPRGGRAGDGAPLASRGGPDPLERRRARRALPLRGDDDGIFDDAAEAQPGSARAGARQNRARRRPSDGTPDDPQGPAALLQPRSPGDAGTSVRRRRNAPAVSRGDERSRPGPHAGRGRPPSPDRPIHAGDGHRRGARPARHCRSAGPTSRSRPGRPPRGAPAGTCGRSRRRKTPGCGPSSKS